jgi:hypothetical protein
MGQQYMMQLAETAGFFIWASNCWKGVTRSLMTIRRDHRYRSCQRKRRYPSRWAAVMAAHSAAQRCGHVIEPYHCRYCRGWHIGHATI